MRSTISFAPKTASVIVIGTSQYKLSPRRSKTDVAAPAMMYKSPGLPPFSPAWPFPATRTLGAIICPGRNFNRNTIGLLLNAFAMTTMTGVTIYRSASRHCGHIWRMATFKNPVVVLTRPVP